MIKLVISIALLFILNIISTAQEIRVEVKDTTKGCEFPELLSVSGSDTLILNTIDNTMFRVDSTCIGKSILLKYKSIIFNLGELDVVAKSILLEYNENATKECFTVNKVYGDTVQSSFDYTLNCTELHNIYLCNTKVPANITEPVVKFRKKGN